MKIPLYQIDAFTAKPFGGNPAAVCPLEEWLDDATMQAIAMENNLSETAFYVPEDEGFHLRWFTPAIEVELCGHATLASAWVIFNRFDWPLESIDFRSRSGVLTVTRDGERLVLDFPARPAEPVGGIDAAADALGARPTEMLLAGNGNALAVFDSAHAVRALKPEFRKVAALEPFGVIATGPGEDCDFVSRYFVPKAGLDEDPVTGSAHCTLVPYWSARLGKNKLFARQVSKRGGELWCEDRGDRVLIAGQCAPVIEGTLTL
ncbi:MAG TPA: PhzF family phenazine biosynthesis protein [Stellaceae bacterium]|jgi:PhzF family phenazine biosynthesis protein